MIRFPETSLEVLHCNEPVLEFAYSQTTAHPKDGLFLYGPHNKSKKFREIRIGVVGTSDGIGLFRKWAGEIRKRVEVPPPGKGEKADRLHLANFPGIEEAFGITFNESELTACTLEFKDIDTASRIVNQFEATAKVSSSMSIAYVATSAMKSGRSTFGCSSFRKSYLSDADHKPNGWGFR